MNDDDKEMLKNLDLLLNMELVQNESDWEIVQNMDASEAALKSTRQKHLVPDDGDFDSPDELTLPDEKHLEKK